mmetsp:Transcript_4959/g.6860  ORF Transcript_4959/g.6860 Transcript_4959/m.6860 type:complete len:443 (+) Transcript_4959:45-1373(+)
MDLLADIGQEDQLTSAREENRVLLAKVKELTVRVHELNATNAALLAEVEMYRAEFASTKSSSGIGSYVGEENKEALVDDGADDFVTAGNGIYASDPAVTLPKMHGISNPLCCSLHPNDTLMATGGADGNLILCQWGVALAPGDESSKKAVDDSIKVACGAPVICSAFAQVTKGRGSPLPLVAAGCMDGSVSIIHCGLDLEDSANRVLYSFKHEKYVKTICWSPSEQLVASASADGTIKLHRVGNVPNMFDGSDGDEFSSELIQSFHFDGPVEAMCFVDEGNSLCCYVRETSYLTYFDLKEEYKQSKYSLNGKPAIGDRFDDHVSFSVLSLQPCPTGKYVAAATDAARNIIMEAKTDRIVRNLYGHNNDGFSNPKIAWSSSGQYIYGNSQNENCVCVWDVASASMVKRLEGDAFVRDIYSSSTTDTVATVSFDKTAKVWLNEM